MLGLEPITKMKIFQTSVILLAIVVVATLAKKTDDEEWEEFKVISAPALFHLRMSFRHHFGFIVEKTRKEAQRRQG